MESNSNISNWKKINLDCLDFVYKGEKATKFKFNKSEFKDYELWIPNKQLKIINKNYIFSTVPEWEFNLTKSKQNPETKHYEIVDNKKIKGEDLINLCSIWDEVQEQ